MLGKLIKNSFKSNAAGVYNIYIAEGIIGVIMLVLLLVDWTKWGDAGIGLGLAIKGLASLALGVTAAIGIIMTMVVVFGDFKRSMYSIEGQLTLSLPVRSSSLLFSKWLSGSLWIIISYLAFCLAAGAGTTYVIKHSMSVVQGDAAYSSIYEIVVQMLKQVFESSGLTAPSSKVIGYVLGMYAFDIGVRACVFVLLVFFAVTLAHCRPFSKIGKLGSVLYFFASLFITMGFSGAITKLVKIYVIVSDEYFTFSLLKEEATAAWKIGFGSYSITNLYCTVIAGIVFYMLTVYLIDRKVNAD